METNIRLKDIVLTSEGIEDFLATIQYEQEAEKGELFTVPYSKVETVKSFLQDILLNNKYLILTIAIKEVRISIKLTTHVIDLPVEVGLIILSVIKEKYIKEEVINNQLVDFNNRFSGATWFENMTKQTVLVGGAGGIGSFVIFLLARLKIRKIIVFDDDRVDSSNLSGQMFTMYDVGNPKVEAMRNLVSRYAPDTYFTGITERITADTEVLPIVICGFDNMEARRITYGNWKKHVATMDNPEEALFIDGRLAAEELQVLSIRGDDTYSMQVYEEEWLFSDEEADVTTCSYKQTTYMANMIASLMINVFVNFVDNKNKNNFFNRDIPFILKYRADLMKLDYV